MAIFQKSKMAAVRHFGIVWQLFKTTHVEYCGNIMSVLNFHSNISLSFQDLKKFIYLRFGLGLPTTPPLLSVFGP